MPNHLIEDFICFPFPEPAKYGGIGGHLVCSSEVVRIALAALNRILTSS
jgi:hypothetical protein